MAVRRSLTLPVAFALLATLLVPAAASAAPGPEALNRTVAHPTTRSPGKAYTVDNSRYLDVASDAAGKRLFLSDGAEVTVERVRPNGRFDSPFGEGGVAAVPTLTDAAAVAPHGRGVIVAGSAGDAARVVRLRGDGSLDNAFGVGGAANLSTPGSAVEIDDLVVDTAGRIVVSGINRSAEISSVFVARLTGDGDLDTTFASDGVADIDIAGSGEFLLAVGTAYTVAVATADGSSLIRVTSEGELDTAFGTDGVASIDPGGPTTVTGIGATTAGRVAVGVQCGCSGRSVAGVAVFDSSGGLDTAFSGDGVALFTTPHRGWVDRGMVARADGRLLVASVESRRVWLIGLLPDGRLDPTVGRDGWAASTDWYNGFQDSGGLGGIAVDEASNTVEVAGWQDGDLGDVTAVRSRISLARTPRPVFSVSNSTATYGTTDQVRVVGSVIDTAVRSSGKLVVLAQRRTGPYLTFAVEKRHRSGRLDPTFADNGTYTFPTRRGLTVPLAVAIQGTSILVAYAEYGGDKPQVVVTRLTADGALDTTFGRNGRRAIPADSSLEVGDLLVEPNGRVVLAGLERASGPGIWDAAIVRLTPNGDLDSSFSDNGAVRVPTGAQSGLTAVHAVARHGAGYLVSLSDDEDLRLVRVDDTGTLDPDFDGTSIPRSTQRAFRALAVAPSTSATGGRIAIEQSTRRSQLLWTLNRSGSPIDTFGTDGRLRVSRTVSTLLSARADGRIVRTSLDESRSDGGSYAYSVATATYRRDGSVDPANPTTTVPVPALQPYGTMQLVEVPAGSPGPFYVVLRTWNGHSDTIVRSRG